MLNKLSPALLLCCCIIFFSFSQKIIKPSGTWIEYRREASTGFCFNAEGKRLPNDLILEFKSKNILLVKKSEDDPGISLTYTQSDSVLQVSATEKIIMGNEEYCRYIGYKPDSTSNASFTCYFINKSIYKKLSEAKKSTLSIPGEADMRYRSKIMKEKTANQ